MVTPLKNNIKKTTWIYLIFSILCALVYLIPIFMHTGWPYNHDTVSFFERTEVFRRAFLSGNFYPLWNPNGSYGLGNPMPLFYHRLFYLLSGYVGLLMGSSILGVKTALLFFLVLGVMGMFKLLQQISANDPFLSLVGAVLFAGAPYTFLNWLVRGAMAEFSAAMIVPWILLCLIQFYQGLRPWFKTTFFLILLFFAHSMIFYFAALGILFSFIGFLVLKKVNLKYLWSERFEILFSALFFVIVVGPHFLAALFMMDFFTTDVLIKVHPNPVNEFQKLYLYFAHNSFGWGEQWKGISVEINRYILSGILVFMGMNLAKKTKVRTPSNYYFLFLFVFYFYLQTPLSIEFYLHFPKAQFLQFPWRLLSFLTPITICILFYFCTQLLIHGKYSQRWVYSLMGIILFLSLSFPYRALRIQYEWYSGSEIVDKISKLNQLPPYAEYLPKGYTVKDLHPEASGGLINFKNCGKLKAPQHYFESGRLDLKFKNEIGCEVVINQFNTPLMKLDLENAVLRSSNVDKQKIYIKITQSNARIKMRIKNIYELMIEGLSNRVSFF